MFQSIKSKLIITCLVIFTILSFSLGILQYQNIKDGHRSQEIIASAHTLQMMQTNMERDYEAINRFFLWVCYSAEAVLEHLKVSSFSSSPQLRLQAYHSVVDEIRNTQLLNLIERGFIHNSGREYIGFGRSAGNLTDFETNLALLQTTEVFQSSQVIDTPFSNAYTKQLIPLYDQIISNSGQLLGEIELYIDSSIITDYFFLGNNNYDTQRFVQMGEILYELRGESLYPIGASNLREEANADTLENDIQLLTGSIGDYKGEYLRSESSITKWALYQSLPERSAGAISWSDMYLIGGILLLSMLVLLAMLQVLINRPIRKIASRIHEVSSGNFEPDMALETNDEFGEIGRGINTMASDIENLINTSLEIQNEKKAYEFKVLQSQINPHFLYNVLNSIKWMATIQKAQGIAEMTTKLGRLLQWIMRIKEERITLEEEILFVRDYVVIQQYRYGDMFQVQYHLEEEQLLKAKIIKFTMQPLIENAIFHGIEPSGRNGVITVRAHAVEQDIVIEVEDNGVGLTSEKTDELNTFCQAESREKSKHSIGLTNIHNRIQLEYGEQYGLTISSKQGQFTCVSMKVPLIIEE